VVPGWDERFVGLVRENSKAANIPTPRPQRARSPYRDG
jgi:hypothetical protein